MSSGSRDGALHHESSGSIYTFQFILLCLSSFLFFASFNMIIPELPSYLESLGGGQYKGLIISVFTLTAAISRPFSGKLADRIGRIPVMVVGVVVCFLIGFVYPIWTSIVGFLFLRLIHGFSTGFKPTGTTAYVADVVPFNRRGEAMGILGISGSTGMAAGPSAGGWIAVHYSLDAMFYASSITALLSIMVLIGMKETLTKREKFRWSLLRISRSEIFEPRVLPPSIIMIFTAFPFGVILTLIPDLSEHMGIVNKGSFFTAFTLSSIGVRFFAGKASDKYGRVPVLRISTIFLSVSLILVSLAPTAFWLMAAGVVVGIAVGMNAPTIFAWTADLSDPLHRGRAMGTMFIAMEVGIMLGAFISGWVYSNDVARLPLSFMLGAISTFFAFLYITIIYKTSSSA